MGFPPPPVPCDGEEAGVLTLPQLALEVLGADEATKRDAPSRSPYLVIYLYLLFVASLISFIFYGIFGAKPKPLNCKDQYPEALAYRRNKFQWLWMGWATEWIARWGSVADSTDTKICGDDVPLTDPGDEPVPNFKKLEKVWKEEIDRVGLNQASILKCATRFVSYKRILYIMAWNCAYETFLFLGPPVALEHATTTLNDMFIARSQGEITGAEPLVIPSIVFMIVFTGLPFLMGFSNTVSCMLDSRVGIQISGAMALMAYNKALRLPVAMDEDALNEFASAKLKQEDEQMKKVGMFMSEQEKKLETQMVPIPKRFNLVQLIERDVYVNIMAIPMSMARVFTMAPVLVVILVMLIRKVGWAFVMCLGVTLVGLVLVVFLSQKQRTAGGIFYMVSGTRLQFFQQVLYGIRFIKGFGGEELIFNRVEYGRHFEIESLKNIYTWTFFSMSMSVIFPRVYILVALFGVSIFLGPDMQPTLIFAIIPLLNSLQAAVGTITSLVPTLIMAIPSCMRVESFLKQPECPTAMTLSTKSAKTQSDWVTRWKNRQTDGNLVIQGSFAWRDFADPVVKGMDLKVPPGSLVGILGHVASGKSTMLNAFLGELVPVGDSRIEVPAKIAYASQVAHIFEGSLRENVVAGQPWDEKRYAQAIHSACLNQDIAVLPGGDQVPCGARGITLSGGQKARVSMARAAYSQDTGVVIIDDPFAAVDTHTAKHLLDHLIHGPLLKGRTRVIVTQPFKDRVQTFDWLVVLEKGAVVAQGSPQDVMATKEYESLLSSPEMREAASKAAEAAFDHSDGPDPREASGAPVAAPVSTTEGFTLREEEVQGRASWATIAYFVNSGGRIGISLCVAFYLIKNVFDMVSSACLAMWMNHGAAVAAGMTATKVQPSTYLKEYLKYFMCAILMWFISWAGGQSWTLGISRKCHSDMMNALLRAPVDKFYDKTPVGRIMNRMANDMMNVDMSVFLGVCSTIGMAWTLCVPLGYVHLMCPVWFSFVTLPFYYIVLTLLGMYWKTMVPLKYLTTTTKSQVADELTELETINPTVRAYNLQEYRLGQFAASMRRMITAGFVGETLLMRWLTNRLFVLGGLFVTCLALLVVWIPTSLDVGTASLCLMTCYSMIVGCEGNLATGASAQYQIIAMNRVFEYTKLPAERPEEFPTDWPFKSVLCSLSRRALGNLEIRKGFDGIRIVKTKTGQDLLQQAEGRPAFLAPNGQTLLSLDTKNELLKAMDPWHRIVEVNGVGKSAEDMADMLVNGADELLIIKIQSGWLADGVKVEIKNLRAGYADVPRDVLSGLNLTIPRKSKVGIVGTTGCGKSTMLLCLLRLLEPREGKIFYEGVDIQTLGLKTLRNAVGLVPQDPVLLQGTLRFNLDPFEQHMDSNIWEALEHVALADFFQESKDRLNFNIEGEGNNLSFGQRQLVSLARNILRQPKLLLLDECTSAIDPYTQEVVQTAIKKSFVDSTLIVVAHRLETILDFDLITVMDKGKVAEKGTSEDLMKTNGLFSKMVAAASSQKMH